MSPKALPMTSAQDNQASKPSWACSCGCPRNLKAFCHWCGEHKTSGETPVPMQCKAICTRSECSCARKFGDRHFLYQCRKEHAQAEYLDRKERRERCEREYLERKERREREHAEYLVRQERRERKAEKQAEFEDRARRFHAEQKERSAQTKIAPISRLKATPSSEGTKAVPDSVSVAASRHVANVADVGKPAPLRIVLGSFVGDAGNCDGATAKPTYEPALPHVEVVQFIREHIVAELPQSAAALIDDVFCYTIYSRTGFIQLVQGSTSADLSQMIRLIKALSITLSGNQGMKPLWCRPDNRERAGHWRAQDFLATPADGVAKKGMDVENVPVDRADDDMMSSPLPSSPLPSSPLPPPPLPPPPLPPPLLPPDQSAPAGSDCIEAAASSERMKAAPSDDHSDVASTGANATAGDDWTVPQPGDTLSAHIGECRGAFFDALAGRVKPLLQSEASTEPPEDSD